MPVNLAHIIEACVRVLHEAHRAMRYLSTTESRFTTTIADQANQSQKYRKKETVISTHLCDFLYKLFTDILGIELRSELELERVVFLDVLY